MLPSGCVAWASDRPSLVLKSPVYKQRIIVGTARQGPVESEAAPAAVSTRGAEAAVPSPLSRLVGPAPRQSPACCPLQASLWCSSLIVSFSAFGPCYF